ncbi:Metallo-peptidase family M12B Reprolysin-like [Fragilaria crotonensis]|nr:Metallo-peptidase family M12B Reprolysin-like [Fragilaria crotonensis]
MKLLSSLLLLALTTSSCVLAVKESPKVVNKGDENRQLRVQRKKTGRSFRRKIKPKGEPEDVLDADGNVKRRKSIVDLRELLLDDDEDDVDVQLMSDEDSQTLKMRRNDRKEDPFESWFGLDETTGHHLTMVKTATPWGNTVTTGTMYGKNGTVYQIRTLADGDVVAEEVKQEMFDSEKEGPATDVEGDDDVDPDTIDEIDGLPDGGRRGRRNLRRLDSSSQLDIMVLYTKGAMCSAAGFGTGGKCDATPTNLAKIEGVIALAVAETNRAYELSGIPTKFQLVKTHFESAYDDYTNLWDPTLAYLRNNGDGQLDYVHAMRDQYGADFVSMLVDTGLYCGIGYKPLTPTAGDAFSLVQWNCATGYYSFAHEIGHNMGCNHDLANAGGDSGGSNYGYRDPSAQFRSILAYDCSPSCPRIQYFSSPNLNYNGKPLGSARADNAALIRSNLAAYANYRQAVVTSTPPTTAPPTTAPPTTAPSTTAPPVSTPAPTVVAVSPTAAPSNTLSLSTSFAGGNIGAAGHMIDIKATTDLYVNNFAMHATSATTVTIEVYKKITTGACVGSQSDASKWVKIGQSTFGSSATPLPTILPKGTFAPVLVKAGTVQSFYVTFTQATNVNRYSKGSTVGSVQVSNSDMQILQGYGKGYIFGSDFTPRAWNGIVYYEKASASATPRPTNRPTPSPTPMPVVRPTQPPTPVPVNQRTPLPTSGQADAVATTFAGGNGQAGNMIEVLASKNIVVKSFDIHTYNTGSVHAYVYYKKGSYVGFETIPSAWTKIADTWVVGKGSPNPTPIPAKDVVPVSIRAGETYSFYITLTDSSMRYTNGKVAAGDASIKFIRSNGNKYPFGASYPDRIWNGVLNYVPAAGTVRQLSATEESDNVVVIGE